MKEKISTTSNANILNTLKIEDLSQKTLIFQADDYFVTKKTTLIEYKERLFLTEYDTLIFKINGEDIIFRREFKP